MEPFKHEISTNEIIEKYFNRESEPEAIDKDTVIELTSLSYADKKENL